MKNLLYTILAAAAVMTAAGCAKEVAQEECEVEATFNVGFDNAVVSKAVSDGLTATQLVVGVYDKAAGYVSSLSTPTASADPNAFSALKATYTARLVKGHGYDIVFIAQAPGNTAYTIDLPGKKLTAAATGASNLEERDAFWAVYSIDKVDDAIVTNVTLKRPFAQLNVIDLKEDYEAAAAAGVAFQKSSLKITAPSEMNLLDGSVGTPVAYELTAGEMPAAKPNFTSAGVFGTDDYWMLTDYILVGTEPALFDVEFSIYEAGGTAPLYSYNVPNAKMQRNYRTNIVGSLMTESGDFTITIDPVYGGMENVEFGEGEIPTITFTDTTLPPAGGPVSVPVDGTINFAATHPFPGANPTYSSSDTSVGTITSAGLFTAVGVGTTVVSVAFPAVEDGVVKGAISENYAAYTLKYTVTVAAKEGVEPTLSVTGAPTAAVAAGESFELTVQSNSTGALTYVVAPSGAANVVAGAAGKFTVTAAELSADTEVTITFSVAAVEGAFKAASKAVTFTVSAVAVPPVETVAAPVFSPAAGEVAAGTSVSITCATSGASVYYTVDGSEPTAASALYSAPIVISEAVTIKAIAMKEGMNASEVVSAAYTIEAVPPVSGNGTGTLEDPFNVAGVRAYIDAAESLPTEDEFYVKGIVCKVPYPYIASSGSASFYISEDGTETADQFEAYYVYYLENKKWVEGNPQVKVGDEVIVYGKLDKYKDTYETHSKKDVYNGYLYSLNGATVATIENLFGVGSAAINVSATATTATVKVTGNVAWTATVDNSAFTLDKTSGEGAGEIKVTFDANTDTENTKVAKITVSTTADVETKSYEVVLTQAKAAATGAGKYVLVNKAEDLSNGQYLITSISADFAVAFPDAEDKGNNVYNVTVEADGSIAYTSEVASHAFEISSVEGGYSIKGQNGKYIGQTANSNGLIASDSAIVNKITFVENDADIVSGTTHLRYNSASGDNNNRFRYYKESSYENQKAVQLYKFVAE